MYYLLKVIYTVFIHNFQQIECITFYKLYLLYLEYTHINLFILFRNKKYNASANMMHLTTNQSRFIIIILTHPCKSLQK